VTGGREPDCEDGEMRCEARSQDYEHPSYWNVLPWFDDVIADGEVANVADTREFFTDLKSGKMASVNWLIPSDEVSEHPRALRLARSGPRHADHQRGHGERSVGQHGDLSHVG